MNVLYIISAIAIAIVVIQTGYAQYDAGLSDHLVVSPAGLLRADNLLYVNDFFIPNSKMPHWAFEFYTALGSTIGQLGLLYFLYWAATVCISAAANLNIAKLFTIRLKYPLALTLLSVQLFGARVMFGTSGVILNQALPHGLAASLAFLILSQLLTGKRKPAFFLLVLVPLIHIQIGTILVGLIFTYLILEKLSGKRFLKSEVLLSLVSVLGISFGLLYRPVAGNIKDFSRLCEELAPHHCYAPSWSGSVILGALLMVGLAVMSGLVIKGPAFVWPLKIIVFVLPAAVLSISLWLDRYNFGFFADFVRGNNMYRFAVILLPFLYWVPLFILTSDYSKFPKIILSSVSIAILLRFMTLPSHGNYFENNLLPLLGTSAIIIVLVSLESWKRLRTVGLATVLGACLLACLPLLGLFSYGNREFSIPRITFFADPYFRNFGAAIKQVTEPGQVVVGNPTLSWLRVASGVAYGVDCKFRPLGGGPPLHEYFKRISPLGSYQKACNEDSFSNVSVESLLQYVEASNGDLLLIPIDDFRIPQLMAIGWSSKDAPEISELGFSLLYLKSEI